MSQWSMRQSLDLLPQVLHMAEQRRRACVWVSTEGGRWEVVSPPEFVLPFITRPIVKNAQFPKVPEPFHGVYIS